MLGEIISQSNVAVIPTEGEDEENGSDENGHPTSRTDLRRADRREGVKIDDQKDAEQTD